MTYFVAMLVFCSNFLASCEVRSPSARFESRAGCEAFVAEAADTEPRVERGRSFCRGFPLIWGGGGQ